MGEQRDDHSKHQQTPGIKNPPNIQQNYSIYTYIIKYISNILYKTVSQKPIMIFVENVFSKLKKIQVLLLSIISVHLESSDLNFEMALKASVLKVKTWNQ